MKTAIAIVSFLMLAGCGDKPPATTEKGNVLISGANGAAILTSVVMPDGTRCVALVGHYKGALSCEWK